MKNEYFKELYKNLIEKDKIFKEQIRNQNITESDIYAELKVLIDEYFVGHLYLVGDGYYYMLPNGQKFKFSIQEQELQLKKPSEGN